MLQNLLEVEYQNFEEINTSKLSQGREGESLQLLVWDYFQDIILKHWLDDLSQVGIVACNAREGGRATRSSCYSGHEEYK